eukprot:CAMPEP_0175086100 /NCGR_PEP_ID=MMETSP0052_2-20121109/29048_1 /TAXON_ID=51329 ORGANISM="Polytomella parva, Strain SAG 63-3" /NCGR_SAMPLE_ID=MMETSP0052_2 /ASSEMBLY_ACC=CAM_ASM_000194 /LENGTH=171 /DNA_ID=CAMNT_0016358219 /DNA_START=106 /DNA_END=621 /DNA_ORIENTATION=-
MASCQPSSNPHPDAIRRRKQHDLLVEKRRMEEASRKEKWWMKDMPSNMKVAESKEKLFSTIRDAIQPRVLVVIVYFSEECYTCKTFQPKLNQIALKNPSVLFLKVNGTDDQWKPLFEEMSVTKVPWFQFVKNGMVVKQMSANLNPEKLRELRDQIYFYNKQEDPEHATPNV